MLGQTRGKGCQLAFHQRHRRQGRQKGRHCLHGGSRRKSCHRHRINLFSSSVVLPLVRREFFSPGKRRQSCRCAWKQKMRIRREGLMESFAKKLTRLTLSIVFGFLLCAPSSRALENGLALTPPMGWNSWNRFGCNVTEDLVKFAADALVSSGMK